MSKTLNSKIQVRRDTSTNWATNDPVLLSGEIGFDTTVKKIKIGDGISQWSQLPFIALTTDIQSGGVDQVYIGTDTPEDSNIKLWIDTDQDGDINQIVTRVVSQIAVGYSVVNESLVLSTPFVVANGRSF